MPDYNFINAASEVKPVQQTSMADMLNLARGAQAYQQAQQINPLDVQSKQLAIQQAQQVNPLALRQQAAQTAAAEGILAPSIARAGSEAETAATGAESAKLSLAQKKAQTISSGYVGAINDPLVLQATNSPDTVDKNKLVGFLKSFGKTQAKAAGVPEEQADQLMQPYIDIAQNNPAGLRPYLIQRHIAGLDAAGQTGTYQTQTAVTPEGRTVTTTPGLGTQKVEFGLAGGVQAGKPPVTGADMGSPFNPSAPAPLPHQVQDPRIPRIPDPTEAADTTAGVQLRQGLLSHLNNTAEANRNLQESFSAVTKLDPGAWYSSGAVGNAVRVLKNLVGSSDYQQLSKDLANVQLSQLQAQGGSMQTDAAKALQARASGSETYNPDVLLNILKRTQAKQTEMQLQAPALQLFSQKFGDANAAKFQQEWSKNADSKVFEAMNIDKYVTDPVEKKKQINELLGNDPKARALFATKYDNINKLIQNGSL